MTLHHRITKLEQQARYLDRYPRLIELARDVAIEEDVPLDEFLADLEEAIAAAGGIEGVIRESEHFEGLDPQDALDFLNR